MRDIISPLDGLRSPFGARRGAFVPFSPLSLFASGEPGGWYDPSDLTTLFQDSAGTTPVTAVEQPVGLMLDKSGRGNHLTQSTSTARPVLSARVNLLTYTEQFDNAAWAKGTITVSANATNAPDGTLTADLCTDTNANSSGIGQSVSGQAANVFYVGSLSLKRGNTDWVRIQNDDASANGGRIWVNLATGALGTQSTFGTATIGTVTISAQPEGFYRIYFPASFAATTKRILVNTVTADSSGTAVVGGTFYIWGADLRVANDGVNLPPYQRVGVGTPGSSTAAGSADYTTTGFPLYLRFDGTDDFMVSPTITPGIDKAQVFAGVRKLSDAILGIIAEFSVSSGANNGSFALYAPYTPPTSFGFRSKGTAVSSDAVTGSDTNPAPITLVQTGFGDISADLSTLRLNGVQVAQSIADQGTGNYGNYPLYVGRRGGTTLAFNGRLYPLIVRFGATLTDTQIAQTESYVSTQMGGGYVPVGYDFLVDANGDQLTDASGNALYTIPLYS